MNLLLALASGVILVLIFPRFDWTWLAPVALTPLLIASTRVASWKARFFQGWAAGFVFWFFICTWIQYVLEVYGGMGRWGGWGTFLLFALIKGAYTGVFAIFAGRVMRKPWAIPAVAALWTGFEYSHGTLGIAWIGLGFSWLDLGNAAIDFPLITRLAPIIGVYGISFVFAMTSAAVALLILRRPLSELSPLAALLVIPLLPIVPPVRQGRLPVRVVQPNISLDTLWTPETLGNLEQRLEQLSTSTTRTPEVLSGKGSTVPLIVWPEAPAPFYPDRPDFRAYIGNIARTAHAYFLLGVVTYNDAGQPLNSAVLVDPEGEIVAQYDKVHLVPFGEYVPPAFGWVNRITGESGDFVPGENPQPLTVNGHTVGTFICYESAFPSLVRGFSEQGADLLVNLSNDGYFGDSAARQQHLSLVRMRALENRRWILRATNTGISAMVDPGGRVTEQMAEYTQTADTMYYNRIEEVTLYARYGDWFAWLCLISGLIVAILSREPDRLDF